MRLVGDAARCDELEERARRLLGGVNLPARRDAHGPQLIRVAFNCSARPRAFVVVTERRDNTLYMLRNEADAQRGNYSTGAVTAAAALGSFRLDYTTWPGCPHCGARENLPYNMGGFWNCTDCGGFNCPGQDWRARFQCSCGNNATAFTVREFFTVHGMASASPLSPRAWNAPVMPSALPQAMPRDAAAVLPRPIVEAAALPRLPGKR